MAGVNRALIDQYILFACAGRHLSDISFERNPDPEFGGGIDSTFAGLIEDGAAAVMDFTWRPWLRRTTKGMVLARLNQRKTAVTKELEGGRR
ncbi:MAG: hypothetical protein ACJ75S_12610 [Solirubrobacterales bacterium]